MSDSDLENEENIPRRIYKKIRNKNEDYNSLDEDGSDEDFIKEKNVKIKPLKNLVKKNKKFSFELTGPVITRLSMAGGNLRTQTGELYEKINQLFSKKIIDILDDLVSEPNSELTYEDLKRCEIYKHNFKKIFKTKTPEKINHILEIFTKQNYLREIRNKFLTLLDLYGINIEKLNQRTLEYHLNEIDYEIERDDGRENVLRITKKLFNCESEYKNFISELKLILKEKGIKFKLNTIYSEDYNDIMKNIDNLDKFKYTSITTKSLIQERDYYIRNRHLLFSPFNTFKIQLKSFLEPFNIKVKDEFIICLLYNMEQYLIDFFSKVKEIAEHANRETITVNDIELLEKLSIKK